METIIHQICSEFYSNVCEFFRETTSADLLTAEKHFSAHIKTVVCQMLKTYYEQADEAISKDKTGRKAAGLSVVRHNDERTVLSKFGEIKYQRTYYYDNKNNSYIYPVDEIMDVAKYQRVSTGVGLELAKAAEDSSYAKSSRQVTGGRVSRQTVMKMVRGSKPAEKVMEGKRKVPVLHVDADEDHVTIVGGKKSMVPLISVYEGIEREGKRGRCKNIFHISEYGKNSDDLWEQVLSEIERRYDLDSTQIYLHGDGAAWISKGLEWLPNSKFVLDKYHKNKYLKEMTTGLDNAIRNNYEKVLRQTLDSRNKEDFELLYRSLLAENPHRSEKIERAAFYLANNIDGINICVIDKEANNGGCTEPHVSHVLSARLSSRPMKWSKETLTKFAPMLADRGELIPIRQDKKLSAVQKRAIAAMRKAIPPKHKLGLPDPAAIGRIPALSIGKDTPLKRAVQIYA